MKNLRPIRYRAALGVPAFLLMLGACHDRSNDPPPTRPTPDLVAQGRDVFRYDTFGDEQQWTDGLRMHEVIETLTPTQALGLGLKVDSEAVPAEVLANADLEDPATTLALIELDAVVGVVGEVEGGRLTRVGISCALCHSTVDDAVAPGIGRRLDGFANTDLDPGAILAASPVMQDPATQAALRSWGPGKYDARFNMDGLSDPAVIPPAYGLADVERAAFTGDGDIRYWNAYVAVTQMGGQGSFVDPRIGVNVQHSPDLVTDRLDALAAYQHSIATPQPDPGSFDPAAAERGRVVFQGAGQCVLCHDGPALTNEALLPPFAVGQDPLHAQRSATGGYRVTPLRGLARHPPYFHDGSAATLEDVVRHYDAHFALALDPAQVADLVEYLKSL